LAPFQHFDIHFRLKCFTSGQRARNIVYCDKIKYDFDLEFMSDKNGGDDFMAEMAQFLKPGDFQRPSEGDSKKLKLKKPKKDKKEKKEKKSKKDKKKKKKKSKSSSSGSDDNDEDKWVDSKDIKKQTTESWMGIDADFMMGMGSVDHKADKQKKREEEYKKKEEEQNRIGQHHRELNPFWKDGGSGLPPTEEELQKKKEEERRAERRRLQAQLQNEPRKNTFSGNFRAF